MAHEPSHGAADPTRKTSGERPVLDGAPSSAIQLSSIEPLHVVSVRVLPESDASWVELLSGCGVARLPSPRRFEGEAVRVLWRSPTEYWLVTQQRDWLDVVVESLRPGASADAYTIDHSAGMVGIELWAGDIDGVLARLVDASAIPDALGQATRARCADLAITLMRIDEQRTWLLIDRPCVGYMMSWLDHFRDSIRAARFPSG